MGDAQDASSIEVLLTSSYDKSYHERESFQNLTYIPILGNAMNNFLINRKEYPELNIILWDMADTYIDPEVAFRMYERKWRHVDEKRLTEKEKNLIAELTRTVGQGYMLVA